MGCTDREVGEMRKWRRRTPVFSNGSEWEVWREAWCESCLWDQNDGCPLVLRMLMHEPVDEIVESDRFEVRCLAWSPVAVDG